MLFTGGQVDLDPVGTLRNPGNLTVQCDGAMAYLARVLEDLDAGLDDLVRLVVYSDMLIEIEVIAIAPAE